MKWLRYAKTHKAWNDNRWKSVLCGDESKFDLGFMNLERDGRKCSWLSVKHVGGSGMV